MKAQFVIIGAGLAGAATAYHLRRLGVGDVVLLEKEDAPGQHSSGRNAAIVRSRVVDGAVETLTQTGAAALRSGELAPFKRTGGLLLGRGVAAAADHFPLADGQGEWCPDDGVVEPDALLQAYLRGQQVQFATELLDWSADDHAVHLRTSRGSMTAEVLVNAAGPWAGAIGDLPLTPTTRHLFQTDRLPGVDAGWPWVWDVVNDLYFRPESGGLLLCACDESIRRPGDYRVDPAIEEVLALRLAACQPRLADVAVRTRWAGQRTFAHDRRFVIGFDAREPRLFHVAGLGGHGVTTSHEVGRHAAALLTQATTAADDPWSPGRLIRAGHLTLDRVGP